MNLGSGGRSAKAFDGQQILVLGADPSVTATLAPMAALGTFGGDLFVHLTAGNDTFWLNLSRLGAGTMLVTDDPTAVPTGGPPGQFAYRVSDAALWVHLTRAVDTAWINMGPLQAMVANFDAIRGLYQHADEIHATRIRMLFGETATASIAFAKPLTLFENNDGYLCPIAGGGVALVDFQVDGAYVPSPLSPGLTVVSTLDIRPWLVREAALDPEAAMSLMNEGLSVILNTVCGYSPESWSEDADHVERQFSWPIAGRNGNLPIVQLYARNHCSVSGFAGGTDALQFFGRISASETGQAVVDVEEGSAAQMSITVPDPLGAIADNDGYILPLPAGGNARVEYQVTDGYVPTVPVDPILAVYTVDIRGVTSSLDVVRRFKAVAIANLLYQDAGYAIWDAGRTIGFLNWPQNTAGGNQPVNNLIVLGTWLTTNFSGGTDPLRQLNRVSCPPVQYLSRLLTFDLFSGSGADHLTITALRLPPGARLVGANAQIGDACAGGAIAGASLKIGNDQQIPVDANVLSVDAMVSGAYGDRGSVMMVPGLRPVGITATLAVVGGVLSDLTAGSALLQVFFILP